MICKVDLHNYLYSISIFINMNVVYSKQVNDNSNHDDNVNL